MKSAFYALTIMSLLVRAVVAFTLGRIPYPATSDPGAYQSLADNLRGGNGLVAVSNLWQLRAFYPPLYSVLLAFVPLAVLNTAIDLAVTLSVLSLGTALGSRSAGKIAAILFLFWPVTWLSVTTPQKDTLALLWVCQAWLAILSLKGEWRWREAFRFSICLGLLGLTQPAFLPLPAISALFLVPKKTLRIGLYSAPIASALMLPWWVRNWLVLHSFIPFTSASGMNMVVAATRDYAPIYQFFALPESEMTRAAASYAWRIWMAEPFRVALGRVLDVVKAFFYEDSFSAHLYWVPEMRPLRPTLSLILQSYWLMVLGLAGWFFRHSPRKLVLLLLACCLTFGLTMWPFEFGERHRYPIVPLLFLVIGWGWSLHSRRTHDVLTNSNNST